jgi:tight adherence protein B
MILGVSALVVIAVFLAMIGVYRWLGWTREVEGRLAESMKPVAAEAASGRNSLTDQLNKRLQRMSFADRLDRQLAAADSRMTVSEFLMLRGGLALAAFVAGWYVSGQPIGGILVAVGGWMAPAFYLRMKHGKRAKEFANQLPDMLSMLIGSLRAGYGLLHAIAVIEKEMPDPIAAEFGRVVKETALGYSLGDALDHLVGRIENEDLALIVTAVHIQSEVGGSLADVLETISKTIRERIQLKNEISAITAQQRTTGYILSALPFIVGTILMLVSPDYMMGMFQPGWPIFIPIGAAVMIVFGNIVMRMVIRIEI